uniref:Uncharacterized protein n=1 Tax=Spironucleus salmonicida TaxID=348837 RepID=V6LB96_9EUKA|eukprot:EST41523.1 Hypothetical protein SS50377_18853 [Spironucleus salmonicida]
MIQIYQEVMILYFSRFIYREIHASNTIMKEEQLEREALTHMSWSQLAWNAHSVHIKPRNQNLLHGYFACYGYISIRILLQLLAKLYLNFSIWQVLNLRLMTLTNVSTVQVVCQEGYPRQSSRTGRRGALQGSYGTTQKQPHQTMQSSRYVKVESQQDSTFVLGHGPCQQDSGESTQSRQNGSQLVGQYRILQPGTPIRYCRQAKSCVQHQARPHYLSKAVAAILGSHSLAIFMNSGNRQKPNFRKQYMIRMLYLIISKILALTLFSPIFRINTIMQLYYLYLKARQLIFAVCQFS